MQRRFLILALLTLTAGLAFSLLVGGVPADPQGRSPSHQIGTRAQTAPAPLEALAIDRAHRGARRAVEPASAGDDEPIQFEHEARIVISPKGQLGEPIADFDFEIVWAQPFGMNRWRTVRVLANGMTGHDGGAELKFCGPELEHYEIRNARPLAERIYFCVRLCEPGFQERFVPLYRTDRQGNTGPFAATIEARPGGTVRGRLVNEQGDTVQGDVRFVRSSELKSRAHPRSAGRRSSDPDGRFQLHVDATATNDTGGILRGACMAWASGIGTGAIQDASWSVDDLPQELEIMLRGAGSLRGVVRDPSGGPSAGLDLILARTDVMGPGVKAHFIGTPAEPFLSGDGLFAVEVRTDAKGRFVAKGLSLARYAIHLAQGHPHARDSSVTLTDEAVFADGSEVELTYGASGLVVQVLAASGEPWPGGLRLVDARISKLPLPSTWPDKPVVLAYPAKRRAGTWVCASEDPNSRCAAKSLNGGAVKIATGNARELLVCVIGGNGKHGIFDGSPVHVTLERGRASFAAVTFRAQAEAPAKGTLVVDAKIENVPSRPVLLPLRADVSSAEPDPAERKTVPHMASAGTRLLIQHGRTGMVMLEADSYTTAPYRFALPPGEYTARAWNDHWRMGSHAGKIGYGALAAVVAAGAEATMDLTLDGGQKITLQVKMPGTSSPTGTATPWARLRIEYEDGRTLPVYHTNHHPSDFSVRYSDAWESGVIQTTVLLPAGRGRIRGRVTGTEREIDVPVEIAHGKSLMLML